ncbi:MAG TPA: translation elongation factor Ts [Dictyoglomaceae bacterium]|nr:translation elongation factor Ts [Dictyoglomaceae bacterium]HOL39800.1 translation elongation factor Ts [Dictyoglomaceae bacterium]HOP95319.1 translation elongation factor Ts [Dictyoglomaceae bacterium]HPP16215.1 translation elongation factor Ts [Dictyoglomaceae bacterium]HPU42941.1 translation elongation factor Ts [Dictyoglomaceae bacterium]
MDITIEMIKELRERTGAGVMEVKKALEEAGGDIEKAVIILREKGVVKAAKKASRVAKEGVIEAYVHTGEKLGVLVEVNCETDFVARTDEFKKLAKDIALQIAGMNPLYVSKEDVPPEVIEREREIYRTQLKNEGKPEAVIEKIIDGKIEKFYEEVCLLEQPFVRNPEVKVKDLITEEIAKLGENIVVRRFSRFVVGEE